MSAPSPSGDLLTRFAWSSSLLLTSLTLPETGAKMSDAALTLSTLPICSTSRPGR